tara:strand:- start:241 stop:510 length:270 start_codon:yes stop_codon:yes gene_type:complete
MSSAQDMDKYYFKVRALSEEKNALTPIERTVVLFRVAFESALDGLGPVGAVHAASRMMTMTLSILDENDTESSFDSILEAFDTDCKMPN